MLDIIIQMCTIYIWFKMLNINIEMSIIYI